ncbi:histidine kinase [Ekhidna sp.]|uniref:sensor histidine kinase n=1 Tax=Ekhidna sp. TaxID=2608089 RepID=UPI0032978E8B
MVKLFDTTWQRQLIEIGLIFLFGGVLQLVLWGDLTRVEMDYYVINFSYSGFFWVMLWKGSEYMVAPLNALYSWFEYPVKRFITSVLAIVVYTSFVVFLLDLCYDYFVFGKDFKSAIKDLNGSPLTTTLMINLVINTFMHGRGFLLDWRQASIDLEKLKTEQLSSQYNSLKNQVNPHFLFNSLNALSSLVYDNQDKAVEFIRKLSQVYRYVLDCMDDEVVSLEREMAFVKNFIFLQKIRFGDNLRVNITDDMPNLFVPPLAIQILVENAIKHNVVSEKDPLTIDIDLQGEYCVVRNNLKEKNVKDSMGVGLENIKARYQYLTDLEVMIAKSQGYFEVKIPLLNVTK